MRKTTRPDNNKLVTRIHKLADDLNKLADRHLELMIINGVDQPTDEDVMTKAFRKITATPEFAKFLLDPGTSERTWQRWAQYVLEAAWPVYPRLFVQALRGTLKRYWAISMKHHDPIRSKGQAEENAEYARTEALACKAIAKMFSDAAKRLEKYASEYEAWQDTESD